MRLIDVDALKEHIDKLPALPDGNFAGTHRNLKALINMQPTVEPTVQQWIPCSERLPNEDEEVLVYLYGNVPVIAWFDSGRWCSEEFDIAKEDEPVAWLPLPQPYRGDGNERDG